MTSQPENENAFVSSWTTASAERLRELVKEFGSQAEVAKRAGISRQSLVQILRYDSVTGEGSRPRVGTLKAICKVLRVGLGHFEDDGTLIAMDSVPVQNDDMMEIAEIDLRFGLGAAFMDEEVVESSITTRPFPRSWLRQLTSAREEDLYWAKGQGNSMEPLIGDGDIILIDRSQNSLTFGDLVWAIAYGQTGMIKRLRAMADGSVKILSDNPNISAELAYDGELHIFGRVVAIVKSI